MLKHTRIMSALAVAAAGVILALPVHANDRYGTNYRSSGWSYGAAGSDVPRSGDWPDDFNRGRASQSQIPSLNKPATAEPQYSAIPEHTVPLRGDDPRMPNPTSARSAEPVETQAPMPMGGTR